MVQELTGVSLADWGSFYVITGSAAAALTGLQFVVMALIPQTRARSDRSAVGAFGTPTIVHFCAVLLISASLSAPWHAALPFISYTVMFIAALALSRHEVVAMFMTGAVLLMVLFIGIHNAWDTVTYIVTEQVPEKKA